MSISRKIVFFGTPNPSCEILQSLFDNGHEILGVITGQDKRRGRGSKLYPTPVKELALKLGLDVFEPANKSEVETVVEDLVSKGAEVGVIVAYGKILTRKVLDNFDYGCINVHYSLLPRWRGAAPVERSILAGDDQTGICIMKMAEELDAGPIFKSVSIPIDDITTSKNLFDQMAIEAKLALQDVLINIDNTNPVAQDGEVTYAHKLEKIDFEVHAQDTIQVMSQKVRAASLLKGAFFNSNIGAFRVLEVGSIESEKSSAAQLDRQGNLTTPTGSLKVKIIQSENKPAMEFSSWANGINKDRFPIKIT